MSIAIKSTDIITQHVVLITGGSGISADDIAEAMLEALIQFVEEVKPTALQKVNFTIYQPGMLRIFLNKLRTKVMEKGEPSILPLENSESFGWPIAGNCTTFEVNFTLCTLVVYYPTGSCAFCVTPHSGTVFP